MQSSLEPHTPYRTEAPGATQPSALPRGGQVRAGPTSPREASGLLLDSSQSHHECWPGKRSTELQPHGHLWGTATHGSLDFRVAAKARPWNWPGPTMAVGEGHVITPASVSQQLPATSFRMLTAPLSPRRPYCGAWLPLPSCWLWEHLDTGADRAFPLLQRFAAEAFAATSLWWQQETHAVASPHADEQGPAVTTRALHTAARTGDQRGSFHQAGVVAGLLHLLSWSASIPITSGHGLGTLPWCL